MGDKLDNTKYMKTTYKGMKLGEKRITTVDIDDYGDKIHAGTEFIIEKFVPSVCVGFDAYFLYGHFENLTIRIFKNQTK